MATKQTYKKAVQTTLCSALMVCSMTAVGTQAIIYNSIPKVMQGTWSASSTKYCKLNDPTRLTVTAKKLQFWETHAMVSSVSKKGNYVTVSAKMTGEGETWDETTRFMLKNNNKKLVHLIDADTEFVRYRCVSR